MTYNRIATALAVILADRDRPALAYAIGYAQHALDLCNAQGSAKALQVQLLYVLNNITHWRHPEAKQVRTTLREFAEG